jgi:hypothetical protein
MKVSHDQASGLMTVAEQVELVAVAQAEGSITVKQAALLLFGSATTNEVEKARRRLDKRVVAGELVKKDEGGASAILVRAVTRNHAERVEWIALPSDDPLRALNILREAAGLQPLLMSTMT